MKNTGTIVTKDETPKKNMNLLVAIVVNNKAYAKKYPKKQALSVYENICSSGSIAIIRDKEGIIKTNTAMLSETVQYVYGNPANKKLEAFEEETFDIDENHEIDTPIEVDPTLEEFDSDVLKLRQSCKIYNIPSVDIYTGKVSWSTVFSGRLYRKLLSMGETIEKSLLLVKTEIPEDFGDEKLKQQAIIAQAALEEVALHGVNWRGCNYKRLFQGASGSRKCTTLYIRSDLLSTVGQWVMNGLRQNELVMQPNKLNAYMALTSSATTKFFDVFGKTIDLGRVVVVPDHFVKHYAVCDFVDKNGNVHFDVDREIEMNAFDGMAVHRHTLSEEAFTLRHFFVKAASFPVDFDAAAEKLGGEIITDIWGERHNIHDVDLILCESCFKMKKAYRNWDHYKQECELRGEEFEVCVREHALRPKHMPYQQGQTLQGNAIDAQLFANKTADLLDSYKEFDKAVKLLPFYMKEAAKAYHPLMNFWYFQKTVNESYAAMRKEALRGKLLNVGYNSFIAADPVAFMQHVLGLPVEGVLEANTCLCTQAKRGFMDITRNPHLDNAHVLLRNVKTGNPAFFMGPTVYMSIHDLAALRIRADFDGDHVFWSQDKNVLDLVRKTARLLKNRPIDWDAPESTKVRITKQVLTDLVRNGTKSGQIGIYVNMMTKVFANMAEWIHDELISMDDARRMVAWLTWAGNVLIDAAKHGSANVNMPKWMEDLIKNSSLPAFAEMAKATDALPVGSDHWKERCAKTNSFLDLYVDAVKMITNENLTVNDMEEEIFSWTKLVGNPRGKRIPGLVGTGKKNKQTGKYEGEGLFAHLAFMTEEERKTIARGADEDKYEQLKDVHMSIKGAQNLDTMIAYANSKGFTVDQLFDDVTRWIFSTKDLAEKPKLGKVVFENYFACFGSMLVEKLQHNAANPESTGFTVEEAEG